MVLKIVYKNRKNVETILEEFLKKYFWDENLSCYRQYPSAPDGLLSQEKCVCLDGDGCIDVRKTLKRLMKSLGVDFQLNLIDIEKSCSYDSSLLIISWYENGKVKMIDYLLQDP